jgi:hypothetical protein
MIDNEIGAMFGLPEVGVIFGASITDEHAEMCHKMGELKYHNDCSVDLQTYKNLFFASPQFSYIMMNKNSNEIIGYFIFLPFTDTAIKKYMADELAFDCVTPNDIIELKPNSLYNLFIDYCVLKEEYRNGNMAKLLFSLIANSIIDLARKFCLCNYIFCEQIKDFTKVICEKFGLKLLRSRKYANGLVGNLYGGAFDCKIFARLPNFSGIEFAYNNAVSNEILAKAQDFENNA